MFSPTLVNTARFGLYKETLKDGDTVNGFTPVNGDQAIKELGIQGVNPQGLSAMGFPDHARFPAIRISPFRPAASRMTIATGALPTR